MVTLFDQIAYRLLARSWRGVPSPYTPKVHYGARAMMLNSRPELMGHSDLRFPYCVALVRSRLADLFWSVRYFLGI